MNGHTLEITTRIGCLDCNYCPQERLLKSYKSFVKELSISTFHRCIDKLPASVDIHFSGFSEPFLNSKCTAMILYARKYYHDVAVFTTLMGFTEFDAVHLERVHFKKFVVHVPDSHTRFNRETFDANIAMLEQHEIKYEYYDFSEFGVISRAGNLRDNKIDLTGRISCRGERHRQNVLLPNGDVYLCCMDYGLKHKLGNLLDVSYESLFKSEEYQMVIAGMKDDSIDTLCRKCERAYND